MVRVLRFLSDRGGSADSSEIRRGVPGYGGESGHRLWRRDLAELRGRGLVAPKRLGQELSSRVETMPLVKPGTLFLTRAEHDALARVEDRFGDRRPAGSPLPEQTTPDLRELAALTRYLEERPGRELTYRQVETALGLSQDRLTQLLRQIVELDEDIRDYTDKHPALGWIVHVPPDRDDPEGYICNEDAAAELDAELEATFDPGERTGQLGFFAYSAHEADDRLVLIEQALAELDVAASDRDHLLQAQWKLRQWRAQLPD
jgi:hypothetical protein